MIFEMFVFGFCIALVFFLAGFHFENYPTFMASGVIFLLLCLGVFTTGFDIKTGTEQVYIYGANFSDYHWDYYGVEPVVGVKDYELFHIMESNVYSSVDGVGSNILGSFLLAMSIFAFGCALIYATPKEDRDYDSKRKEWNYY